MIPHINRILDLALLIFGLLISIYSIIGILILSHEHIHYSILLILGSILMVCSAILKVKSDLELLDTELHSVRNLHSTSVKKDAVNHISNWRIRDLEYRVKRLEEKLYK
ncbi:MAG: hypothetical protein DRO90_00270 [Candidatus Altiarchaeales archaeon]|nr:MAG: hypothetical protein DRO94_00780 [Candidatus Altiarchaeales archaeon]RLI95455.1 MAG: hypothetical protein DRO90_00270 [Candidatus Altiarchaeales archaeon]HDO81928.1 hypothetical protein [Candidatus Altiarchaeales archaeon]HEX54577.1 hypothetical protein [Candidatus Altiarchaeales archaeon]